MTLVAPFFSDIDISDGTGNIKYEVHTQQSSPAIFSDINAIINEYVDADFFGSWLLLAEWKNVPEFGRSESIVSYVHL